MKLFIKSFFGFVGVALACMISTDVNAQFGGFGGPGGGIGGTPRQGIVEFDLGPIINCDIFDPDDPLSQMVCEDLLMFLIDDLIQAEEFCDAVFVGYRDDLPLVLRNLLQEPVFINVSIVEIDGPGNTLAQASPLGILELIPPPFLQARSFRPWSIPRSGMIELDLDDIEFLLLSDGMVDTVVHEAFHALGHPFNFQRSGLNVPTSFFGQPNFVGDRFGINGVGYGITEFRIESSNPLAMFVPLSQADGSAHLSTFEEAFFDFDENLQEVFIPFAAGLTNFMSRTLRGMFADMGYMIRGINAPGFIDIDGDAAEDIPLIVDPEDPADDG